MTHVTCRLTAKDRDQLRSPTLGNQVWATFLGLGLGLGPVLGRVSPLDRKIEVVCACVCRLIAMVSAAGQPTDNLTPPTNVASSTSASATMNESLPCKLIMYQVVGFL